MNTLRNIGDAWEARDASSNPERFSHYLLGALSALVDPSTWDLALEAAKDADRSAAKAEAAS